MQPWFTSLAGKYEIVRRLRGGGMGHIYVVRHRQLDELRVVKVMRTDIGADPSLAERFVREARLASQLRHPSIAQIYDFSTDERGQAFLVMEFIEGVTFERLIEVRPPAPLRLVVEVTCQALNALSFLHRKEFVHRDIAPDNLMLTRDVDGGPLVKLIDLGIAKSLRGEGLTATGGFLGKIRYAPPEQLEGGEGEHAISTASDLYAMGIVLYQLLTGRFPIAGTSEASLLGGHLFKPPLPFADSDPEGRVPASLRRLVLQCLEKDPTRRPAGARELIAELRRIGAELPEEESVEWSMARLLRAKGEGEETAVTAGTTQDRLDREFAADEASKGGGAPAPIASDHATPREAVVESTVRLAADALPPTIVIERPAEPIQPASPEPIASPPPAGPAAVLSSTTPSFPRWARAVGLAVGAAAAVAVIVASALWWRARSDEPATGGEGVSSPPVVQQQPVAPSASVELVALPWARVESIRDAQGKLYDLGANRFTPLRLTMPPGRYTIVLRHPARGEREVSLDVRSGGGPQRAVVDLGAIDVDAYLQQALGSR